MEELLEVKLVFRPLEITGNMKRKKKTTKSSLQQTRRQRKKNTCEKILPVEVCDKRIFENHLTCERRR